MKNDRSSSLYEWPDLAFHHYCLQMYRLNRGVYNTIDQWLYDNGYAGIKGRRKMIIQFLDHMIKLQAEEGHKYLSFGKGNLVAQLSQFAAEHKVPVIRALAAY
ncbi:hypothetical protein BK120_18780 [Paenibacillus sp. FSL A5-0031]|uniref:hypothetical protein n=1 Tax=Paenibacillus sp. FSL A5-0031 TaxID=1920420 RepID=UPI000970040E|nr:hypothetical protein [Paenibacillus sp. FSL A5-0031]OME80724.1 hypothetical protein BK120_18780 [Paenibacillus sp. FSL A5-0031]